MVQWKHKLNLSNPLRAFEINKIGLGQLTDEIAVEITNSPFYSDYPEDLEGIVEELQDMTDKNSKTLLDEVLESLYDWADGEELDTIVDGVPRRTKTCWIETD